MSKNSFILTSFYGTTFRRIQYLHTHFTEKKFVERVLKITLILKCISYRVIKYIHVGDKNFFRWEIPKFNWHTWSYSIHNIGSFCFLLLRFQKRNWKLWKFTKKKRVIFHNFPLHFGKVRTENQMYLYYK